MADVNIDKVQIEIEGSANSANKVIETLEKNLKNLKSSMTGFNTSALDGLVTKLNRVADSLDKVSSKSKNNILPKVDTSNMTKAEKDIKNSTQKIKESFAGLKAYGDAAMGGDQSALFSFDRNATKIQSQIDVLKEKFKALGDTRIKSDAFLQLEQDINKTNSLLDALKQKNQDLYGGKAAPNDSNYVRLQGNIQKVSDILDGLIDKQRTMMQDGSAYTDPFQGYRDAMVTLETQLDETRTKVHDAVDQMNSTPVNIDTGESVSALDTLKSSVNRVSNSLLGMVGTGIMNGFKNLSSGVKKLASDMSKLHSNTNKATGGFKKGFMTILKYGFGIRSLYVGFRRLRKSIVESFGELQKSGAFVDETKRNIEGLKASLTTLKFQFGAAFQPIFNTIAPALQTLIDYLVRVMNIISAFTAKLMGKSTYSKAVATTGAIADNVGGAAKSAKELNKQLQGFDELNNMTSNTPSSGGGGGGSAGDASGANYVTENVDSVLGDFAKELADKINAGDWRGVGEAISNKLTEVLESIPWDKIYQKAANFGIGLAEFLNGLITPDLFSALGGTIAGAINTALEFLSNFGETFEWTNFGNSIAAGINRFFENTNFALAGDTVHTWVAGILDAGFALLTSTDFEQIGEKIAEFLNNLKVADLAIKLVKCAKALVGGIATAIESLWTNSDVTTKISLAVVGLFAALKLTGLSSTLATTIGSYLMANPIAIGKAAVAIATFTVTFEGAKWLFGNIADDFDKELASYYKNFTWTEFIETIMKPDGSGVDWQEIKDAWNDMMDDYFKPLFDEVSSWVDVGKNIVEGIKTGIKEKLDAIGTWVSEKFQAIIDAVKEFFGIQSPSTKFMEIGGYIVKGLLKGITNGLSSIGTWVVNNIVNPILNAVNFSGIIEKGKSLIDNIKTGITQKASDMKEWFTNNVTSKISAAWDTVKNLKVNFASKYKDLEGSVSDLTKKLKKGLATTIKTKLKEPSSKNKKSVKNVIKDWKKGLNTTITMSLDVTSNVGRLENWINNKIIKPINDSMAAVSKKAGTKYTAIPYLAQGGFANTATPVVFGEAGAEAIIPLERNLGAINKIAKVMLKGMANVSKYQSMATPSSLGFSGSVPSSAYSGYSSDVNNDMIAEQNRLLAEQNRLLQQIASKNVTISSRDVFNATRQEAQNYNNRTGNSPFLF